MMIVKQKRSTVLSTVKMTLVVCQFAFRMELLAVKVSLWANNCRSWNRIKIRIKAVLVTLIVQMVVVTAQTPFVNVQ